jgi:hypothetical protein
VIWSFVMWNNILAMAVRHIRPETVIACGLCGGIGSES